MKWFLRLLITAVVIFLMAFLSSKYPCEYFDVKATVGGAVVAAIVLGLLNTFVRPICKLIAFPITVITLGLFLLVINALMVMLCSWVMPAEMFHVGGFISAVLFSVVLSIVTGILASIFGVKKD
jgi:putative membrane protein